MTRVLLTGATGFVGQPLALALAAGGHVVRAALRTTGVPPPGCAEHVVVGELGPDTSWHEALRDVDQVMHLAARAHVASAAPSDAALCLRINASGTQRLLAAARASGVRRFTLLSTVKVNGENSAQRPFLPDDLPRPQDAYALSKLQAEQHVRDLTGDGQMEGVIVRAPLVYGAGVRANFLRLMQWVDAERPLPLAGIHNARSLVSLWNLCDLLVTVTSHAAASGRTFMVSDGEDLSTPELIRRLAAVLGRRPRLWACPPQVLRLFGRLLGKAGELQRLCDSLSIDMSQTRALLGWSPPLTIDEGLARTARWFRATGVS
jgi:nucleoside-diphosphate-sugar epimerase